MAFLELLCFFTCFTRPVNIDNIISLGYLVQYHLVTIMSLSEEENDDTMSSQLDETMLSEIKKEAEQGRTNHATA